MTETEYQILQERLSNKMTNNPYRKSSCNRYETAYKEGILAAKSILSNFMKYERGNNNARA